MTWSIISIFYHAIRVILVLKILLLDSWYYSFPHQLRTSLHHDSSLLQSLQLKFSCGLILIVALARTIDQRHSWSTTLSLATKVAVEFASVLKRLLRCRSQICRSEISWNRSIPRDLLETSWCPAGITLSSPPLRTYSPLPRHTSDDIDPKRRRLC